MERSRLLEDGRAPVEAHAPRRRRANRASDLAVQAVDLDEQL